MRYKITHTALYYKATWSNGEVVDNYVYMLDGDGNRVKDAEGNYIRLPH